MSLTSTEKKKVVADPDSEKLWDFLFTEKKSFVLIRVGDGIPGLIGY